MKQWLVIRYNNKDFEEHIYKTFNNEEEAIKWFDDFTLETPPSHFKEWSYELLDCYGEMLNCTL